MSETTERHVVTLERSLASPPALLWLAAGAAAVVLVGVVLGSIVDALSPVPAEEEALAAVAEQRTAWLTTFFLAVTTAGDLWAVALAAAVATVLVWRRPGGLEVVWLLWGALAGSLLITSVIKIVVGRARPLEALVGADTAAFPSGHTSRTAAVLGLCLVGALVLTRHPATRALAATLLFGGIVLMGFSRVYLGVHWPSDVAFGLFVGAAWLAVLLAAVRPRLVPAERAVTGRPPISGPTQAADPEAAPAERPEQD